MLMRFVGHVALLASALLLASCGGGGSGGAPTPNYFVDAVYGNDSNSGTQSSPWQSLHKVSTATLPSGSTIFLKRGTVWNEQLTIPSSGITIDAYGTGALPIIDGSTAVTGTWVSAGAGLYSTPVTLSAGEGLGNLSENGSMMSFLPWNTDAATTFASAASGTYSYNYATSTLYIKPALSPSSNTYRASVKFYGIQAASRSDVTIRNVVVTRFSLHGVGFADCIRCSVYNATVTQGGGATIAAGLYAGNGIEFDNASANGVVDGVTVSDIFDSGISPQTFATGKTMSSITISNSTIGNCGFAGVEVSVLSNGGTTGSAINGVSLSGLTISNTGKGWSGRRYGTEGHGIRIIADTGAGTMSNVQVATTTITGSAGDGIKLGGEIGTVVLHRMGISTNALSGIEVSEPSATSLKLRLTSSLIHHNTGYGISYNSPTAAGFELYQDTFSDNGAINLAVLSQNGVAKIQNDIFYGSAAMTHLYSAAALVGAVVNNNCYNEYTNMFGYISSTYNSVALFNAGTGFDANGVGGTVGLASPASNFMLTGTSQCIARGNPAVGIAGDYSGYVFANPPSSGAYQYR
jgi:hypothetical protein